MSGHTSTNSGDAPLNDVDMDDLSDITRALPAETASHEPNDAHDTDAVDGIAQETRAFDADENSEDMTDVANATSAGPEASPHQPDRSTHDDKEARLRLEQFESLFAGQTVELKNLAPPTQCAQHPEQAQDILEAFFDHATFTVKIWVNFDAAEQVFFGGARAADCGKLQIPKARLDYLTGLDTSEINFGHVCLDICTPFRTLAQLWLDIRDDKGKDFLHIGGKMVPQRPPRRMPVLREFIDGIIARIDDVGVDRNLNMDDLTGIARLFRRQHVEDDGEDEWEQPAYEGGEWVGVEKPSSSRRSNWY